MQGRDPWASLVAIRQYRCMSHQARNVGEPAGTPTRVPTHPLILPCPYTRARSALSQTEYPISKSHKQFLVFNLRLGIH